MAGLPPPPIDRMRVLLELVPASGHAEAAPAPTTLPPCFKSDGARFGKTDTSLKLIQGEAYKLTLVCSPPSTLEHAEMTGLGYPLAVALESVVEASVGVSTHSWVWSCGLPINKRSTRHSLGLQLNIQEFGELTLPLQVKVYALHDNSVVHGSRLRHMQYLFKNTSDGVVLTSMQPFALSH